MDFSKLNKRKDIYHADTQEGQFLAQQTARTKALGGGHISETLERLLAQSGETNGETNER